MSFIAGCISLDGTGRLNNTPVASFPAPLFNGGTPVSNTGRLVTVSGPLPTSFVGGLGYNNAGAICTDPVSAIGSFAAGGIPVTADGRMCTSTGGVIASWVGGIPILTSGRVALATAT